MISPREKQVLYLIAHEYTTTEIAQKLHISGDTVKTHRKSLLTKVGARNVAGLVRRAFENQLLKVQ
jgi:DNA-binding CsgD family transcriptional regulator